MYYFSIKSLLQLFYFATKLPVRILINNRVHWQLPHSLKTLDELTQQPTIKEFPHKQVSTSEWGEEFWSFTDKQLTIIIGPLFFNKIPSREKIRKRCDTHHVSFALFSKAYDYLKAHALITDQKQFTYATLLAQAMLETQVYTLKDANELVEIEAPNYQKSIADQLTHYGLESTYVLEKQLIEHIKNNYLEDAYITLQELNELNAIRDSNIQRNYLFSLCTIITRAFIDLGVEANLASALSNSWMDKISPIVDSKLDGSIPTLLFKNFSDVVKRKNNALIHPSVGRALFYIDNHMNDKISVQDVADYAHVHPNYLSNLFKKELGQTVIHVINERKILASCHLLAHSSATIIEITTIFGFCNQAYYTRWFKKIMGCTPTDHRFRAQKIYTVEHRRIGGQEKKL